VSGRKGALDPRWDDLASRTKDLCTRNGVAQTLNANDWPNHRSNRPWPRTFNAGRLSDRALPVATGEAGQGRRSGGRDNESH